MRARSLERMLGRMLAATEVGAVPVLHVVVDVGVDVDEPGNRARKRPKSRHMREQDEGLFGFEKLDAYQRAVEFVRLPLV